MQGSTLLWPEGAPLAAGFSDEDCPALIPYLVEENGGAPIVTSNVVDGGVDDHTSSANLGNRSAAKTAVIVCPGGGYARRAQHEGEPIARWLNTLGISAFVLRYRVAPYSYPCAWMDAQRAIRWVRSQASKLGIAPDRIGILGFSAGGHVASTAGTMFDAGDPKAQDPIERESSRPDFMVLCYPVITMKDPYTHEGSRRNLLGPNPDPAMIEQLSTETRVTADTPPTFLWHTSDDASVPVENSLQFAASLRKHDIPFDLHVYARGRHGLGLAAEIDHVQTWPSACESWLRYNGYI